jgi:DNA modification methylase
MTSWRIIEGDCRTTLAELEPGSVQTCVTSPPYFGLRDYDHHGQIGAERNLLDYIVGLCHVFRGVHRVLHDEGTLWLNLGDSYDKDKSLMGVPWKVAHRLRQDGWLIRSDIIWHKPNPMPESVTDRPTKAHEYVFLLSKQPRYYYDADAIREENRTESNVRDKRSEDYGHLARLSPEGEGEREWNNPLGRNKRSVWKVASQPFAGAHFATFPPKLIEPCILAGCPACSAVPAGAAQGYHRAGLRGARRRHRPAAELPVRVHPGRRAGVPGGHPVRAQRFDAVHASPPCQAHSDLQKQNKRSYPDLDRPDRELLHQTGLPYVIENVEGAPLIDPITLCGTMFPGLRVIRHRLFESNFAITAPAASGKHPLVFTHDKRKAHYGKLDQDTAFVQVTGGGNCTVANKLDAMGIDWMTGAEVNEAIPPAYTEHLGHQIAYAGELARAA